MKFETDSASINLLIEKTDPVKYARTRNFVHGDVTYLSPYISRGVISTKKILLHLIHRGYSFHDSEKLIQELAWREYFQRVLQHRPHLFETAIKQEPEYFTNRLISRKITEGKTGIAGIDESIHQLYQSGYMHNHCRMYLASLACNWARSHWQKPADWMYYHLLDADVASNYCSWQWVCGAFSSKRYYANQDNVNRYTNTHQKGSFMDISYDEMESVSVPDVLNDYTKLDLTTQLPKSNSVEINQNLPVLIYHFYNLDPDWHKGIEANRILLLEPSHFDRFPVSDKTIEFVLQLSQNISGIQVFVGELNELKRWAPQATYIAKEHPLFGYENVCIEPREWMFEEINDYYPSFSAYWKKCERIARRLYFA